MKLTLVSSSLVIALLGAGSALSTVACGSSASSNEAVGSLAAAVTTVGPDGALYALPSGATLSLVNSSNASQNFSVAVDGSGSTEWYKIPVGTYSANLSTVSSLLRTGDAGPPTSVPASLSDAQPYQVVVSAGQTTNLTFHFAIAGTGANLTFSTGEVNTSVSVSTNGGSSTGVGSTFQVNLSAGGTSTSIGNYGTGNLQGTITVTVTGPFVPTVNEVCAPIGSPTLTNVADNGYAYNILQASGGAGGYICFSLRGPGDNGTNVLPVGWDANAGWTGNVAILLSNAGLTANQDEYLLTGWTTAPAYDGTTLQLSNLAGPTSFTAYSSLYWTGYGVGYIQSPATLQLLP